MWTVNKLTAALIVVWHERFQSPFASAELQADPFAKICAWWVMSEWSIHIWLLIDKQEAFCFRIFTLLPPSDLLRCITHWCLLQEWSFFQMLCCLCWFLFFVFFRCLYVTVPNTVTWANPLATWKPALLSTVSTCLWCPTITLCSCHF